MIDPNVSPVRGMQAGNLPLSFRLRNLTTARGEPIPPAERAIACDISHWSGAVNFNTMYTAGARGVYFKASQGVSLPDDKFDTFRRDCTCLPWGAYHFLTLADGTAQCNYFWGIVQDGYGLLPPVLDVELASVSSSVIRAFITRAYTLFRQWPMIYTSAYFWSLVTGATDKTWISERCPLWVAHYGTDYPLLPSGWTTYTMHQYSADRNGLGNAYGAESDDMDLNRCRRDWLPVVDPPLSLDERVTRLETAARAHGWNV